MSKIEQLIEEHLEAVAKSEKLTAEIDRQAEEIKLERIDELKAALAELLDYAWEDLQPFITSQDYRNQQLYLHIDAAALRLAPFILTITQEKLIYFANNGYDFKKVEGAKTFAALLLIARREFERLEKESEQKRRIGKLKEKYRQALVEWKAANERVVAENKRLLDEMVAKIPPTKVYDLEYAVRVVDEENGDDWETRHASVVTPKLDAIGREIWTVLCLGELSTKRFFNLVSLSDILTIGPRDYELNQRLDYPLKSEWIGGERILYGPEVDIEAIKPKFLNTPSTPEPPEELSYHDAQNVRDEIFGINPQW